MEDVKQIIVVSRSTADCKKAFHYGVFLARACGASLSVLHVEYDPFEHWGGFGIPRLVDVAAEYRAMTARVRKEIEGLIRKEKAGGMHIKEIVEEGNPADVIMAIAQKEMPDLLIMPARHEGRIEHIVYGRFNHEVVRKLPC